MIGKLVGVVDSISEDQALVDVNGVGYVVFCSATMLRDLPSPGSAVTLYVETHVREDSIKLFGFKDWLEKGWFVHLQGVQGVGARVALASLHPQRVNPSPEINGVPEINGCPKLTG